jgi:ABC-2 type transport system permease protein
MTAVLAGHAPAAVPGGTLTGTGQIVRLILRRDRLLLLAWIVIMGLLPVAVGAAGSDAGYPTDADKLAFAAQAGVNPAELATRGPVFAATTGGLAAWTLASSGVLVSGVVSLLLVIRQTRVEEQAGRRELLGSAVLGRHAPLAAALAVVAGGNLALGLVAGLGLVGYGLPPAGSAAFGLVFALGGVVFAAVGAVAAQLVEAAGAARAIALAVMASLFAVAAVGEVSASGLVWASPFGWARRVQAFAGDRWWVLVPFALLIVVLVAAAFVLSGRRDVGAGLVPARPGPARAPAWLHSPVALAWRLQRGAVLAWTVGFTLLGALLGAAMGSLGTQLDTPAFREFAADLGGGSPADVFFRFILYVLAQVVAASMIAAALRLRGEETAGLGDVLLAGPVGRTRWALGHIVVTVAGGTIALAGLGLGAGVGYGTPLPIVGTTLAYLPACLVFAALAVGLTGWAPRLAAPVTWTVLGLALAVDLLGEFRLAGPQLLMLSPFVRTQIPLTTGSGLGPALLGLVLVVAVLTGAGLAGLRRRDLGA